MMEARLNNDNDRIEVLEKQLREAKELAADSDRKYEEVSYCQKEQQRKTPKIRRKQSSDSKKTNTCASIRLFSPLFLYVFSLKWIFLGNIRLKLVKNHEILILYRQRKSLEARSFIDEERITTLEKQLAEAQIIAEDADRRYDEVTISKPK